jgi:histidinol-phosphate aminotransferase
MDLLLDANEGASPPAGLMETLSRLDAELLRRYPNARPLEAMIAQRFGLAPEQVVVTAGADDALYRVSMAMLEPGREVILPTPTFEMLPRYARLAGAKIVEVPWVTPAFPLEAVRGEIRPATAMIAVVSPNNPTGTVAEPRQLEALAAAAPHALIAVDLAYGEFAAVDLTPTALALPNAVVFRSFSKAWGMAGLRVGYAMGPAPLIGLLRAAGNPFSVTSLSIALVTERLKAETAADASGAASAAWGAGLAAFRSRVQTERVELRRRLTALGADAWPAEGNFVLARFRNGAWFRDALAGLGIGVRAFMDRPEIADCVRITCPCDEAKFARLCHAVDTALAPQGVIVESEAAAVRLRGAVGGGGIGFRLTVLAQASLRSDAVQQSLAAEGIQRAWCVTERAEAVAGLRAAGVVPIGLTPGGVGENSLADALFEAGAARVVTSVEQVAELLP